MHYWPFIVKAQNYWHDVERPQVTAASQLPPLVESSIIHLQGALKQISFWMTANILKGCFAFLSLLWGLGATYALHLKLIGKRAVYRFNILVLLNFFR